MSRTGSPPDPCSGGRTRRKRRRQGSGGYRRRSPIVAPPVCPDGPEEALHDAVLGLGWTASAGGPREEAVHGEHSLSHSAVTARRTEIAEGGSCHVTCAPDIPHIAHGDVEDFADHARDHRPLHPLGLEAEVGE